MSWFGDKEFLVKGYEKLTGNVRWRSVGDEQEYLYAGVFGKMSELNTWLRRCIRLWLIVSRWVWCWWIGFFLGVIYAEIFKFV